MKIFALESSASISSVALIDDGNLIAQYYQNCGLTHSRTLLPMASNLFENCGIKIDEVDYFALSTGPGSFTGLRIGLATIKAFAYALDKRCIGVSSLEAMAYNVGAVSKLIVCVMDARLEQVYCAIFKFESGILVRKLDDCAISICDLKKILILHNYSIIMVGDGAKMCYSIIRDEIANIELASENFLYQSAYGVGMMAYRNAINNEFMSVHDIELSYLRLPQAERNRILQEGK